MNKKKIWIIIGIFICITFTFIYQNKIVSSQSTHLTKVIYSINGNIYSCEMLCDQYGNIISSKSDPYIARHIDLKNGGNVQIISKKIESHFLENGGQCQSITSYDL